MANNKNKLWNVIKKRKWILLILIVLAIGSFAAFFIHKQSFALASNDTAKKWPLITTACKPFSSIDSNRIRSISNTSGITNGYGGSWTGTKNVRNLTTKHRYYKMTKSKTYNPNIYQEIDKGILYNGKYYDVRGTTTAITSGISKGSKAVYYESPITANCLYSRGELESAGDKVTAVLRYDIFEHGAGAISHGANASIPDMVIKLEDIDVLQGYKIPVSVANNCWYANKKMLDNVGARYKIYSSGTEIKSTKDVEQKEQNDVYSRLGNTYRHSLSMTYKFTHKYSSASWMKFYIWRYKATYVSDANGKIYDDAAKTKYLSGGKVRWADSGTLTNGYAYNSANPGYTRKGWTANRDVSVDGKIIKAGTFMDDTQVSKVLMNNDVVFTLHHEPKGYTVTYVSADNNGEVTGETSEKVSHDNSPKAEVTDTPKEGYENTNKWTCVNPDNQVVISNKSIAEIRAFKVTESLICKVSHIPVSYQVTYESADNNGVVGGTTTENVGYRQKPNGNVTDTPNTGYKNTNKWTCYNSAGTAISGLSNVTLTAIKNYAVTQNMNCKVPHVEDLINVYYTSDPNGRVTGIPSEEIRRGTKASGSNENPNEGYKLKGWQNNAEVIINGSIIPAGTILTDDQVRNAVITTTTTFKAIHTPLDYTITYETDEGGTITNPTTDDGKRVDTRTLNEYVESGAGLKTKEGYEFKGWSCKDDNGTPEPGLSNVEMPAIEAWQVKHNLTCKAVHELKKYTLTYLSDPNGDTPVALDSTGTPTGTNKERIDHGNSPNGANETPHTGYSTSHWTCDKEILLTDGTTVNQGERISYEKILNIYMNKDLTCTVHHIKDKYKVTYDNKDGFGKINNVLGQDEGSDVEDVEYRDNPSGASESANKGYKYSKWTCDKNVTLKDGTRIDAGDPLTPNDIKNVVVTENLTFTVWYEKIIELTLTKYEELEDGTKTTTVLEGAEFELHEGTGAGSCSNTSFNNQFDCESHGVCKFKANVDGEECDVTLKGETAEGCEQEVEAAYGREMMYTPYEWEATDDRLVGTYTTNDLGQIIVNEILDKDGKKINLEKGKEYYFIEKKAPSGYEMSSELIRFSSTGEDINLKAYNKRLLGKAKLVKTDQDGKRLDGAEFGLYKKGTENSSNEYERIGTYTTDANGEISVEDLAWTDYYFKELTPPAGYTLNDNRLEFTVNRDNVEEVKSIKVTDEEIKGSVTLTKYDDQENVLEGAKFNLYKTDGTLIKSNLTSGQDGKIKVEGLSWGTYYFDEIEAPEGFGLSSQKIRFEINRENFDQDQEVSVKDIKEAKPYVSVTKRIKKSDIVYEHGEASFIFRLSGTDLNNKEHEYYRTVTFKQQVVDDSEGEYVSLTTLFKELEKGEYTLTEENTNRYQVESITNITSGVIEGSAVNFDLRENISGKATYTDKKIKQSGLTDTAIRINIFSKKDE